VKSRDDNQLLGHIGAEPSSECDPFVKDGSKFFIPCGAIANSMFSGKYIYNLQPIKGPLVKWIRGRNQIKIVTFK